MDEVNSGSSAGLTVAWKDKLGVPVVPISATYSIRCLTTGTLVRAATAIGLLAASVELTLTPTDTTMQNPVNVIERKRVIVVATFGTGDTTTADYPFSIRNVG